MLQIPIDVAQVVGVFVECIFYGIYLVTFAASLWKIVNSRPETSWASRLYHHRSMLAIVLSIFTLSTMNLALGLVRILAFLHYDRVRPGVAEQGWIDIFKPVSVQVETMIADCVLIYRCWIVYNKLRRVLILPFILCISSAVCTVLAPVYQARLQDGDTSHENSGRLSKTWFVFWLLTISLNIYATSMIVLRIWRVESESRGKDTLAPLYVTSHPSRLQTAMKAVIESGLLYTITSIITFISIATGSNSHFITSAISVQTTGIAFNLILIRVNPNAGERTVTQPAASTEINFTPVRSSTYALASCSGSKVPTEQHGIDCKVMINSEPDTGGVEKR